ncbi:hypothetical protein LEN26_000901 [Aphanomyces euteiches]|nr:hypothetical protein AeMF1_010803 [Aphanomyces euteiches]KAH9162573.1 hypothetical protein LEN26_000901 [Aphanomyces euteiches]KAH9182686.1 hypothetical protein AeNC1_015338 [Aphanomyces euteiches]
MHISPSKPLRKHVSDLAPASPRVPTPLARSQSTSMDTRQTTMSLSRRIKKHFRHGVRLVSNASYKGLREPEMKWRRVEAPTKHRREDQVYSVLWVDDDALTGCMLCQVPFGMYFRRHHCHSCGDVVCSDCSKARQEIYGLTGVHRVCDVCMVNGLWMQQPPPPPPVDSATDVNKQDDDQSSPTDGGNQEETSETTTAPLPPLDWEAHFDNQQADDDAVAAVLPPLEDNHEISVMPPQRAQLYEDDEDQLGVPSSGCGGGCQDCCAIS